MICRSAGRAPVEFTRGQTLDVRANKITCSRCIIDSEYYPLLFLKLSNETLLFDKENLYHLMRGDRIVETSYRMHVLEDITCNLIRNATSQLLIWDMDASDDVIDAIRREYFINLYASFIALPAAYCFLIFNWYFASN